MPKVTANYETVVIFNTKLGEEGTAANVEKFKSLISENGHHQPMLMSGGKRKHRLRH